MSERLCSRLGLPIPNFVAGRCNCGKADLDELGFHIESVCKTGNLRNTKHNGVRDAVIEFARQGKFTCRPESREICLAKDPSTRKKVDAMIDNWDGPTPRGIDVAIVDPRKSM